MDSLGQERKHGTLRTACPCAIVSEVSAGRMECPRGLESLKLESSGGFFEHVWCLCWCWDAMGTGLTGVSTRVLDVASSRGLGSSTHGGPTAVRLMSWGLRASERYDKRVLFLSLEATFTISYWSELSPTPDSLVERMSQPLRLCFKTATGSI